MAVVTGGRKLLPHGLGRYWGRYCIYHLLIQVMMKYFAVQPSVQNSVQLYGNGVLCDSPPDFDEHNDPLHDSPTDNEVSKYSFYSRLTHYMEGHKITFSLWNESSGTITTRLFTIYFMP